MDRDLLRPYIKAPPPPRPARQEPTKAPNIAESLRVVSLSEWEGVPEVHILDAGRKKTERYRPGDKLKDNSEIVAIDYRAMPSPGNPLLLSHSRVILKNSLSGAGKASAAEHSVVGGGRHN